jgi:hypothetical protein
MTNRASVQANIDQPGSTAAATTSGGAAAIHAPIPDIRDEAEQPGDDAPQDRAGQSDQIEGDGDEHAEGGIERKLRQKVFAQPPHRVVEGDRRAMQIAGADQPNEPVAEIVLLQKDEQRDHQHDAERVRSG